MKLLVESCVMSPKDTIQEKTTRIQKYRIQFLWEDVSTVSKKRE